MITPTPATASGRPAGPAPRSASPLLRGLFALLCAVSAPQLQPLHAFIANSELPEVGPAESSRESSGSGDEPDVTDSLVSRWRLDAAPLGDDSAGSNEGSVTGSVSLDTSSAMVGAGSARFLGSGNNYLSIPDAANLDNTGKLSVAFWVKPTATGVNGTARGLVSKRAGVNTQASYSIFIYSGGRLFVDVDVGSSTPLRTDSGHALSQNWQHVAVVFDGSLAQASRLKIYVNKTLVKTASVSSTAIRDLSGNLHLGALNAWATPLDGWLDDVRIYRGKALSTAELETIYAHR